MSIYDSIGFTSGSSETTAQFGASLCHSLYHSTGPLLLFGPLGSGKTTFVQGLARALGVDPPVTSPTFALMRCYGQVLLHIDLFRVREGEATNVIAESEGFPGRIVIEWADHLPRSSHPLHPLMLRFSEGEQTDERVLRLRFLDAPIPPRPAIDALWEEAALPGSIRTHCTAVARLAAKLARHLRHQGHLVRMKALTAAALLHDLLRFLNMPVPSRAAFPPATQRTWATLEERYPGSHEVACANLLTDRGHPILADIVRTHGVDTLAHPPRTIEQKLLYYSDKRVALDRIVSIDDRFDDFARRYGGGKESPKARQWREEAKAMERELFPQGVPI